MDLEKASSSQTRKWCEWGRTVDVLMDGRFLYLLEGGTQGPGRRPHLPYLHLRLWMYRMLTHTYKASIPLSNS